jgi:hypothetical protein
MLHHFFTQRKNTMESQSIPFVDCPLLPQLFSSLIEEKSMNAPNYYATHDGGDWIPWPYSADITIPTQPAAYSKDRPKCMKIADKNVASLCWTNKDNLQIQRWDYVNGFTKFERIYIHTRTYCRCGQDHTK